MNRDETKEAIQRWMTMVSESIIDLQKETGQSFGAKIEAGSDIGEWRVRVSFDVPYVKERGHDLRVCRAFYDENEKCTCTFGTGETVWLYREALGEGK